jgi:hypothetical protein
MQYNININYDPDVNYEPDWREMTKEDYLRDWNLTDDEWYDMFANGAIKIAIK